MKDLAGQNREESLKDMLHQSKDLFIEHLLSMESGSGSVWQANESVSVPSIRWPLCPSFLLVLEQLLLVPAFTFKRVSVSLYIL